MGPSHYPHTTFVRLEEDLHQRPLMLKDFLRDDHSHYSCSSSSSPLIVSHQRYPMKVSPKSKDSSDVQVLSRSKSAAMRTISAFHKVINLVKMIPFASRSGKDRSEDSTEVKVKVKDILRWTSFRDLEYVGKSTPLDHLTTITTLDSSSSSSTSSSYSGRRSSSWSQSDLTADDLPFWCGENKEYHFNNTVDDTSRKIPKGEWAFEECDQQSPISVLHDSLFLENEGAVSPCHARLSNTSSRHSEERVMMDEVEEKAKWLLSRVRETDGDARDDRLILDFFQHELSISGKLDGLELDGKILEVAKSWKKGECEELLEWELEDRRGAFVRDMEREVGWTKLSCEVQEMCEELQMEVWSELLCEALSDFHAK